MSICWSWFVRSLLFLLCLRRFIRVHLLARICGFACIFKWCSLDRSWKQWIYIYIYTNTTSASRDTPRMAGFFGSPCPSLGHITTISSTGPVRRPKNHSTSVRLSYLPGISGPEATEVWVRPWDAEQHLARTSAERRDVADLRGPCAIERQIQWLNPCPQILVYIVDEDGRGNWCCGVVLNKSCCYSDW